LVLADASFAAPYAPQSCDFNGIDIGIGVRVKVDGFYLTESEHAVHGKSKNRITTHHRFRSTPAIMSKRHSKIT